MDWKAILVTVKNGGEGNFPCGGDVSAMLAQSGVCLIVQQRDD